METEVKLAFKDRESLNSAAASDWFAANCKGNTSPMTLENIYLDTKDCVLGSRGAVFRKRHYTGKDVDFFEFTVKCELSVSGGIANRYEWNVKSPDGVITAEEFKIEGAKDGDDPKILEEVLKGIEVSDLVPLCSNSFERTLYDFSYGSSSMEACIDYGEIKDGVGKTCDIICEMELELKDGTMEDLEAAKAFIMSKTDAEPFNIGKFQRTLRASRSGGSL